MRTVQEIESDARPQSPFSNGDEGEHWMAHWCYAGCVHEPDCPLLLAALGGLTPREWREYDRTPHRYDCVEYRAHGGR